MVVSKTLQKSPPESAAAKPRTEKAETKTYTPPDEYQLQISP